MSEVVVGDLVEAVPPFVLRSGSSAYLNAVCVHVDPLVLVSCEGDMLWYATLKEGCVSPIGKPATVVLEVARRRFNEESKNVCKRCGCSANTRWAKYCGDGSDKDNEHRWEMVFGLEAIEWEQKQGARARKTWDELHAIGKEPVKPDGKHPEDHCHRCGGPNITWFAPSPLWNSVMRKAGEGAEPFDGIVCPVCFAALAKAAGIDGIWSLAIHPFP